MSISKIIYKLMYDEQAKLLFSSVTDFTYVCDREGNILFVNKMFEKLTGGKSEEFYGKPFTSLFDASDLEKVMDAYKRTLTGEIPHYELSFKNAKVLCEYRNFPMRDERGVIIGVMGIARDITSRKQHEEELKILNESLEKRVIEHSIRLSEVNEELMEEINDHKCIKREFTQSIERLQKSLRVVIHSLASTVELKDVYAAGHQKQVAQLARCIAEEMGLLKDKVDAVVLAAIVHDIGKISISAGILCKADRLTSNELDMVRTHPQVGYDLLKEIEFPYPVAQIVLQHHERVDGSGYPFGLSGKDILLEAKILGIADAVEAMVSPRSYRPGFSLERVLSEISQQRGILYDFNVAHACFAVFHKKGFKFNAEPHSSLRLFEDILSKV